MASRPRDKGTRQETRLVRFLQKRGINAERVPLKGVYDEEDIHIWTDDFDALIQVKWRRDIRQWTIRSWAEAIDDPASFRVLVLPVPGRMLDHAVVVPQPSATARMRLFGRLRPLDAATSAASLVESLDRVAEVLPQLGGWMSGTPCVVYRGSLVALKLAWFLDYWLAVSKESREVLADLARRSQTRKEA